MILLMGLAGSGKGTQGKLLSEKLDYQYLSTGDFLRAYLTEGRKQEMLAGKLIDDQEMIEIIDQFLGETNDKNQTILDGFPRSEAQAKWLINKQEAGEIEIEALVYLKVSEDELTERLLERGRADDTEEAIKVRFSEYLRATSPVMQLYKEAGINIVEVNGTGEVEQIHTAIVDKLETSK